MVKVILFDCDGVIIKRGKYFSQRLKEEKGIDINPQYENSFFRGEFLQCEIGKADLKQILPKWLKIWNWPGAPEDLLDYWFKGEITIDNQVKEYIEMLRKKGIKCYLSTNNEKYRTEFLWNEVGLKIFLDGMFSSCYLGYMKPQKEFWQEVYKNFASVPKNEIVVVDDKQSTVDSAKLFGFQTHFYSNLKTFKNQLDIYLNTI